MVDLDDEAEEVEEAAASDAEDRVLGQKVSLHDCTSVGEPLLAVTAVEHTGLVTHSVNRLRSMLTVLNMW